MYGDSDDLMGKWFALHPKRRQDIFLSIKFAIKVTVRPGGSPFMTIDSSPDYAREVYKRSIKLRRTGLIYITSTVLTGGLRLTPQDGAQKSKTLTASPTRLITGMDPRAIDTELPGEDREWDLQWRTSNAGSPWPPALRA